MNAKQIFEVMNELHKHDKDTHNHVWIFKNYVTGVYKFDTCERSLCYKDLHLSAIHDYEKDIGFKLF